MIIKAFRGRRSVRHCPRPFFELLESRQLLSAGEVVAGFGDLGEVSFHTPSQNHHDSVIPLPQPDGTIYLMLLSRSIAGGPGPVPYSGGGGSSTPPAGRVVKLTASGGLDSTFSGDGVASFQELGLPEAVILFRTQRAPDGGHVLLAIGADERQVLIKVNSHFQRLTTFGNNGEVRPATGMDFDVFTVLPNGNIVLVAETESFAGGFNLELWSANGTFLSSASVFDALGAEGRLPVLGIDADGQNRLYLSFHTENGSGLVDPGSEISGIARFDSTLTLDTGYGDGDGYFDIPNSIPDMVIASDGRAAIRRGSAQGWAFAVVSSSGAQLFQSDEVFVDPEGFSQMGFSLNEAVFQPDGKVIAGLSIAGQSQRMAVATVMDIASAVRMHPDGSIDTTFGQGGRFTFFDEVDVAGHIWAADFYGDLILAGTRHLLELNYSGPTVTADSYQRKVSVIKLDGNGDDLSPHRLNFSDVPIGATADTFVHESGYRFRSLPGTGSGSAEPMQIYGGPQGFAGRVLHASSWGRRIVMDRADSASFDLASFDYGAGRWGEKGDFTLTAYFADGSNQSHVVPFGLKGLDTLDTRWRDVTRVEFNFAGGVNSTYGSLSNFVFDDGGGTVFNETGGRVDIQAEGSTGQAAGSGNAANHTWNQISDGGAGGGAALISAPNTNLNLGDGTNGPRRDYAINFTNTGTFYVWVRMAGPNGSDDSLHVGLNGALASAGGGISLSASERTGAWFWKDRKGGDVRVTVNVTTPGVHTLNLWMREDGTRVDGFVLTRDANFHPEGVVHDEEGGRVDVEAEAFAGQAPGSGAAAGHNWQLFSDGGAFLGQALRASPNSDVNVGDSLAGPRRDYAIRFTNTGTYYIWARLKAGNGSDDSVHLGWNAAPVTFGSQGLALDVAQRTGDWRYTNALASGQRVAVTVTSPGTYTLNLWMREDGAQVDQFILSRDAAFNPNAIPESGGLANFFADQATGSARGTGAAAGHEWQPLGGGAIVASPNNNLNLGGSTQGPRRDYVVRFFNTGTYYVWAQMSAANATDDSITVGLNGSPTSGSEGLSLAAHQRDGAWRWASTTLAGARVTVNVTSAGFHAFNLWMREDGARVGQFILTRDPNFTPG